MKRIAAVGAAVVGLLAPLGLAAPAQADQRTCVSQAEYDNIRWTLPPAPKGRVTDHFDTRGEVVDRWGPADRQDVIVAYRKCPEWGVGRAFVWYDNYSWDWRMRVYAVAKNGRLNWQFVQ